MANLSNIASNTSMTLKMAPWLPAWLISLPYCLFFFFCFFLILKNFGGNLKGLTSISHNSKVLINGNATLFFWLDKCTKMFY
jgi:hypothetical protein